MKRYETTRLRLALGRAGARHRRLLSHRSPSGAELKEFYKALDRWKVPSEKSDPMLTLTATSAGSRRE
ncbi:MAG: hypothetical protein U0Y68_11665 [Blastocatellia bacterium]